MPLKRGFTLIELLVVLALTGSLMAMLFPVLARVREKGRATTCLSNLRQLGLSMAMYAQDADELYPRATDAVTRHSFSLPDNPYSNTVYKTLPLLTEVLAPYVKNDAIWRCPSDVGFNGPDDKPTGDMLLAAHPTAFEAFGSSYNYGAALALRHKLFATGGYRNGIGVGTGEITVLGDLYGGWHGSGSALDEQRYNYLMGDGHIRFLTWDQRVDASKILLDKND